MKTAKEIDWVILGTLNHRIIKLKKYMKNLLMALMLLSFEFYMLQNT